MFTDSIQPAVIDAVEGVDQNHLLLVGFTNIKVLEIIKILPTLKCRKRFSWGVYAMAIRPGSDWLNCSDVRQEWDWLSQSCLANPKEAQLAEGPRREIVGLDGAGSLNSRFTSEV